MNPLATLSDFYGELVFPGVSLSVMAIASISGVVGYLIAYGRLLPKVRQGREEVERSRYLCDQQRTLSEKKISDLQDELEETQKLSHALPVLSQRLNARDGLDAICTQMVSIIDHMLPAQQICVWIANDQGYVPWFGKGIEKKILRKEAVPFDHGKMGWIGKRGLTTYASQLQNQPGLVRNEILGKKETLDADIYLPLTQGSRPLGMVTLKKLIMRPRFERHILGALKELFTAALAGDRAFQEIAQRANRDGLTGLYNMTFFKQHMQIEIDKARRNQEKFALFMLDLDHFKHYNDTNGHPAGDDILRQVGQLFSEHTRAVDICARYGGEEFIVLSPGLTRDEANLFAKRFQSIFLAYPFPHKESQPEGAVSFSAGIAAYPNDGLNVDELIRAVDAALYRSKHNGRNQITMASGPVAA